MVRRGPHAAGWFVHRAAHGGAGAGPGGLSAALCLGRAGRQVLVLDSGSWRNVPSGAIHNFLSRDGVTADELRATALAQLRQYPSVKVQAASAEAAGGEPGNFQVTLSDGRVAQAHRLVLATGVEDVLPDIPGLNERWGQSVVHCPYCHGWERAGLALGVLAYAEPRSSAVLVTQVLVTKVTSRALTLDEIRSYGIVVDSDSYQAFNFTFAFAVAGETVAGPARDVDESSRVAVDGGPVAPEPLEVHALNKPAGVVSTARDTHGRPTVVELVRSHRRLYPVGRLDADSTGLLLLTNDGDLANLLMARASAVPRTYYVKLEGRPDAKALAKLEQGITLDGRRTVPCQIRPLAKAAERDKPWYEITLVEGRYHQVRRMFERIGQAVVKLKRVRIAFLTDRGLAPGRFRFLTGEEISRLKNWKAAPKSD